MGADELQKFKSHLFNFVLLLSLMLGAVYGYFGGDTVIYIKPLGDLFLNLIFTAIVPLIFFSVCHAIAKLGSWQKVGKLLVKILTVFLGMGLLASGLGFVFLRITELHLNHAVVLSKAASLQGAQASFAWYQILSVSEFYELLSHHHILALMLFAILMGMALGQTKGKSLAFIHEGEQIFMQVFGYIIRFAPIGFFAYFANIIHDLGPQILNEYGKITLAYYVFGLLYFFGVFSFLIYLVKGRKQLQAYWGAVVLPATTALATCSSAATIPANLLACKQMNLESNSYETLIPLGTMIHKQGSIIGAIFKIALMYSIFHLDFHGMQVMLLAMATAILFGCVEGAIPSGGMIGELLILSVYGFPNSALIVMSAISILIDPPATVLNACGNLVATVLISQKPQERG